MKTIYESKFYNFCASDQTKSLVFVWKPETGSITDHDFKEALSNFAGYGFELGVQNMIVDVRQFRPGAGAPSDDAGGPWRARVVVPRYNQAGVKKFAYIRNPDGGGPPVSSPTQHPGEEFETAVFDSEEKMNAWLTA